MASGNFGDAVRDYRLFQDRGYPVTGSLKLVGDRYRLDKPERVMLFRGVLSRERSERIARKLVDAPPAGSSLGIDGYNVLFTIANYRKGHPLFIGTDGLLRDAGGAHGRFGAAADCMAAMEAMTGRLAELRIGPSALFLDAPVSGSGDHASTLRAAFTDRGLRIEVHVVQSADPLVRDYGGDAIASSDSAVAESAHAPVFDLARDILAAGFGAVFLDLRSLLG